MHKENRYYLPKTITPNDILKMFLKKVCGQDEVWINGEPILVTVNYRITDERVKKEKLMEYGLNSEEDLAKRGKVIPEKKGLYTQSPVIEINDLERFKQALYDYVEAYTKADIMWTAPNIARDWEDTAMYTMLTMWTDATRQDFANPIAFLKRYTAFLTENQWQDLKQPQKVKEGDSLQIWKQVKESAEERETPYHYCLYAKDKEGKRYDFPAVCYGIEGKKAYVYAIHNLQRKPLQENEELQVLRNRIKGRGVEPLAIAAMLSFLQEAKERGITRSSITR